MSESAVVSACIKWLWAHGCYVWRNNTGFYRKPYTSKRTGKTKVHAIRYGLNGSGDIIGMLPCGRFLSVETKFGKGVQEDDQKLFQERVEAKGGVYIVAYNLDELAAKMQGFLA